MNDIQIYDTVARGEYYISRVPYFSTSQICLKGLREVIKQIDLIGIMYFTDCYIVIYIV